MNTKFDFKKEYKNLYSSKQKPALVDIPPFKFIMIDGKGKPKGENYQNAMQILYYEYVVPPLEGLWCLEDNKCNFNISKDKWLWTSMIAQPNFVTKEIFDWALNECKTKKTNLDFSKVRFETFCEGLCVQAMHIGPYDEEYKTISKIDNFIKDNNLKNITNNIKKHHEIYLSDPRRTASNKLRTILRIPVQK